MRRKYDAVIVGGGPGGLAVGCLLAREGISSAIVEKAPALGGRYRSVDFHGCRVDSATHFLVSLSGSTRRTATYEYFSDLGIPLEQKMVPWTMGMVSKEKPGQVDHFEMDPKLGPANFFEFFAFATGVEMHDAARQEIMKVATLTGDMSQEECRKLVNVCFADWIDEYVEDPIARAVMHGMGPIIGAPPTQINFGFVANAFRTFTATGSPLPWYPAKGTLQSAIIDPLASYYADHGGDILTSTRARSIVIENGKAVGVVTEDYHNQPMFEVYEAPAVVCAIPIFQAVSKHILAPETLTEDWAESVRRCEQMAGPDLSGFFLLREEVLPREGYGWIHVFDTDYGIPTYVGDCTLGGFVNAEEPPGKQLVTSMVPGTSELNPFGRKGDMAAVLQAHARWKESMEKAFPGFNDAIEHEGMNLQLNFARYAYAVVPVELDLRSPNIEGLYFGGDSVRSVGAQMSDKCFDHAFPVCEMVRDYLRT